jgi:hypothetical protein
MSGSKCVDSSDCGFDGSCGLQGVSEIWSIMSKNRVRLTLTSISKANKLGKFNHTSSLQTKIHYLPSSFILPSASEASSLAYFRHDCRYTPYSSENVTSQIPDAESKHSHAASAAFDPTWQDRSEQTAIDYKAHVETAYGALLCHIMWQQLQFIPHTQLSS